MASQALDRWQGERRARLDEIVAAHVAVGGVAAGRRTATAQLNHAYAILLSSEFQGYCRDLHSEAVDHVCAAVGATWAADLLRARLTDA